MAGNDRRGVHSPEPKGADSGVLDSGDRGRLLAEAERLLTASLGDGIMGSDGMRPAMHW